MRIKRSSILSFLFIFTLLFPSNFVSAEENTPVTFSTHLRAVPGICVNLGALTSLINFDISTKIDLIAITKKQGDLLSDELSKRIEELNRLVAWQSYYLNQYGNCGAQLSEQAMDEMIKSTMMMLDIALAEETTMEEQKVTGNFFSSLLNSLDNITGTFISKMTSSTTDYILNKNNDIEVEGIITQDQVNLYNNVFSVVSTILFSNEGKVKGFWKPNPSGILAAGSHAVVKEIWAKTYFENHKNMYGDEEYARAVADAFANLLISDHFTIVPNAVNLIKVHTDYALKMLTSSGLDEFTIKQRQEIDRLRKLQIDQFTSISMVLDRANNPQLSDVQKQQEIEHIIKNLHSIVDGSLYEEIVKKDGFLNNPEQAANENSEEVIPAISYSDYNPTLWWAEHFNWAINKQIIKGTTDTKGNKMLKPNKEMTESQYLAMLFRFLDPFGLAEVEKKQTANVPWDNGVYELASKYNLPVDNVRNTSIRRGTVARILASSITGKTLTEREAVQWLYSNDLSTGYADNNGIYPKTYESYLPNQNLTRAQGIAFLHRFAQSSLPKELNIVEN